MATDISAYSAARVKDAGFVWGGGAEAGQGAERAYSCSGTAKAGRSSANVFGELAEAVAPSGAEVRGVGRAVTAVPGLSGVWAGAAWARTAWALVGSSCADAEIRGVEGAVAAMPRL